MAQGFTYPAAHFDARPEWVYVVGASRNIERAELLHRMDMLIASAMTAYGKRRCFIVVDRDSASYEVGVSRPDFRPTSADHERADHFFGRLKVRESDAGIWTLFATAPDPQYEFRRTNGEFGTLLPQMKLLILAGVTNVQAEGERERQQWAGSRRKQFPG